MGNEPTTRGMRFRRRVLLIAITAVLLMFFSVPIAIIFYGGAAGGIGGLVVIGLLIVCQLPVFMLLKWLGALPEVDRRDDE
ncbi:hypothetical protein ACFL2H_08060 [Planctomycetota bacterium]